MTNNNPKKSQIKNYVLDTNVLIHDPSSWMRFKDNTVIIPVEVTTELDKFKSENSARGESARKVIRDLEKLFPNQESLMKGVPTPGGGKICIVTNVYAALSDEEIKSKSLRMRELFKLTANFRESMDDRILACAIYVSDANDLFPPPTHLVSKDVNVRLRAKALGLIAEDYRNDKTEIQENENAKAKGYMTVRVDVKRLQRFRSEGQVELSPNDSQIPKLVPYCYVFLQDAANPSNREPAKHLENGQFRKLISRSLRVGAGITITPRNDGQRFLIDALLDESVDLVTVEGKAGSGKTLLATAAALYLQQSRQKEKFLATRAIIPMGRDIGFLPGSMEEKMHPWLQPIYDALELLLGRPQPTQGTNNQENRPTSERKAKKQKANGNGNDSTSTPGRPVKPYQALIDSGKLEIQPMAQIRGRSIPNAIFLVDECQNTSSHEMKTIITRMAEKSKIILMGDTDQIDNPLLDKYSNGLAYVQTKLRGQKIAAHVILDKSERSPLAELAANLL
jgi:PhoH-like ATPase